MAELTITPDDITASLRQRLSDWKPSLEQETIGYVTSIADGVARVKGLPNVMASELLEFPGGLLGVALNIDEDDLGV
ncbi:MAG: F0F1 ATP synthase subunit alpha, partial [Acidimicrobiia bacterium]